MTKEELKRKQYDTWNKYYQKHKSEINARRKQVREDYKNKLSVAEKRIAELEKENAELKSRDCWKSCEYANPKAELIEQHIKDVQNLTKAKKIIKKLYSYVFRGMEFMELNDFNVLKAEAEQFISEVKNDREEKV